MRSFLAVSPLRSAAILLLGGLTLATAAPAQAETGISGTYAVRFDRTCVRGPARPTATPAFFRYSTPDTAAFGFVQAPVGLTPADVANMTTRTAETGTYLMVVNPLNNTITVSSGAYHTVPFAAYATAPVSVADFATFTGSGSFVRNGSSTSIDAELQTLALVGDGVSQTQTTNVKYRLETRDKGENFHSITGRGTIRLQHNLTANFYRDAHCTGITTGTRVSRAF